MKLYKIFKNPMNQYEAVKQGWSWPAFFFGAIWACVKKMWGLGIGIFVTFVVLNVLAGQNEMLFVFVAVIAHGFGQVVGQIFADELHDLVGKMFGQKADFFAESVNFGFEIK